MRDEVERIREAIEKGSFPDEAAISNGVVLRILHLLKWPAFDTDVVWPQYQAGNGRVDFALCHPPKKPAVLVEVKRLGSAEVGEKQLFEYAFHQGIPMVVLTDGQEWHFYLPAERGSYHERRAYLLDIVERDLDEVEHRLKRYLDYQRVQSGDALESAREDYRSRARQREVAKTLPQAWNDLVADQDDLLLELLADKVESLCGFKPARDDTAAFLSNLGRDNGEVPPPRPRIRPRPGRSKEGATPQPKPESAGFTLENDFRPARSAKAVLVKVLEELSSRDPTFAERMAARPKHGRKRRYIARTPEELYPDRPDLARDYSHQLSNGWWVGVNYGARQIKNRILAMAAEVAGLQYGRDLVVHL